MRQAVILGWVLLLSEIGLAQLPGVNGDCSKGGQAVVTQGLKSSGTTPLPAGGAIAATAGVLASYPSCLLNVYLTGTLNPATVYSDAAGTQVIVQPFTANTDGSWLFFTPSVVDIVMSGAGMPSAKTLTAVNSGGSSSGGGGGGGSGTVSNCTTLNALGKFSAIGITIGCDTALIENGHLNYSVNGTFLLPAYTFSQSDLGMYAAISANTFPITNATRTGGVSTLNMTSVPSGLSIYYAGQTLHVASVTGDTSFNGDFPIASISGSTITYAQALGNSSGTGGTVAAWGTGLGGYEHYFSSLVSGNGVNAAPLGTIRLRSTDAINSKCPSSALNGGSSCNLISGNGSSPAKVGDGYGVSFSGPVSFIGTTFDFVNPASPLAACPEGALNSCFGPSSDGHFYMADNGGSPLRVGTTLISGTPAANQVAIWTAANTAKGVSGLTADGSGNLTANSYTSAGSGAGLLGWTQGTDNSATCPLNSVCREAPTSVTTSYTSILPGTGPAAQSIKVSSALSSAKTTETFMQFQHARITTGSISGTTRVEVLLTWATTFTNTSYTPVCNVEDGTTAAGTQGLTFERIKTKSATQVGAIVNNPTGGALTGTVDCAAWHD